MASDRGLPDDYMLIITYRGKSAVNEPQHKMLGNSMDVPVMRDWRTDQKNTRNVTISHSYQLP